MAMTLRLTADQDEQLTEIALAEHISKTEVVTIALCELYERRAHTQRVESAFQSILERDRGLLARLADA